ncbi:acyltransferase family protein [Modestobacter sp. URMC 112]
MPAPTLPKVAPPRLGMLDALRFIAAFAVVAFHYTARVNPGWGGAPPVELAELGRWTSYGRLGVPLFFVISGFVLLMSAWGKDVPSFVASRIGRLFPAYWLAVVLSAGLVLFLWPENPVFFGHTVTKAGAALNLTMIQSAFGVADVDGPYWTLWYEARFYLLIAVFMLVGINRRRVLAFCALWPVVGAMASASGNGFLVTLLMPDYAPFFAGGMLLYLLYRDGHDLGTWLLVGFQVLIAVNFTMAVYPQILTIETPWVPSNIVIGAATLACFGLVALVTLTRVNRWHARWMVFAGALTYPVYLLHENLGWYLFHLYGDVLGPWAVLGVATASTLLAATAVHYAVERPFGPRLRRATLTAIRRTLDRDEVTSTGRHHAVRPSGSAAAPSVTAVSVSALSGAAPAAAVPSAAPGASVTAPAASDAATPAAATPAAATPAAATPAAAVPAAASSEVADPSPGASVPAGAVHHRSRSLSGSGHGPRGHAGLGPATAGHRAVRPGDAAGDGRDPVAAGARSRAPEQP